MDEHNFNRQETSGTQALSRSTALIQMAVDLLAEQIAKRVVARMSEPAPDSGAARPLLDVKATAERLGLSSSTVYKLAARQALPSVKIRERLLFEPEALDAYVASRRRDEAGTLRAARNARSRK